jgi:hypothetical protein
LQIILFLISSLLGLILLIKAKPYNEPENNWIAIINEFAALLYLYIVLPLTDFMPVPDENP